jgi:hypothetical protein
MWKDFIGKCRHVLYELYRQEFEAEKITLREPLQDECDKCVGFEEHKKGAGDHSAETYDICPEAQQHLNQAKAATDEYKRTVADKSYNKYVFAVDKQKVILLPKMTIKEHFFESRLVVSVKLLLVFLTILIMFVCGTKPYEDGQSLIWLQLICNVWCTAGLKMLFFGLTTVQLKIATGLCSCYANKTFVFGENLLIIVKDLSSKLVIGCRKAMFDYVIGCYDIEDQHEVNI